MEEKRDISKNLALVLIILTVLISAASTWLLVTNSTSSESSAGINDALVKLHILRADRAEPLPADANSGDVQLFIAKSKGG